MNKVTCRGCKFLVRVETDYGNDRRCAHPSGMSKHPYDPLTGRLKYFAQRYEVKNENLDCEDFEQREVMTFWQAFRIKILGFRS